MQRDFDNRVVLKGVFDFKTCAYNGGGYYGTADSNQCRKGTEVSLEDLKADIKARDKKVQADSAKVLSGGFSKDLTVASASKADIASAKRDIAERSNELEAKLNSDKDATKEIESFITDRRFLGDHMTATTIVVGMEDATSTEAGKSPEAYNEIFSRENGKK